MYLLNFSSYQDDFFWQVIVFDQSLMWQWNKKSQVMLWKVNKFKSHLSVDYNVVIAHKSRM